MEGHSVFMDWETIWLRRRYFKHSKDSLQSLQKSKRFLQNRKNFAKTHLES